MNGIKHDGGVLTSQTLCLGHFNVDKNRKEKKKRTYLERFHAFLKV
jgi:hypothetical protein